MNKQILDSKRQKYQVRIRKEKRAKAQSQFRHNLHLRIFGSNLLVPNSYDIQRIVQIIKEYIDKQREGIQFFLEQFISALDIQTRVESFFGSEIVRVLRKLYYAVKRQGQMCVKIQDKILCVIAYLPRYPNILTAQVVVKEKIIEFIIDILKTNSNSLKAVLYIINQISQVSQIKDLLLQSRELRQQIEKITEETSDKIEQKSSVPIIKLLLSWWGDVDLSEYNLQTVETIYALYKISNQAISNYYTYLLTLEDQTNQIIIVNALKITHSLLKIYQQDILQRSQYKFSPNPYSYLIGHQSILEGKPYILQIMAILILNSIPFCHQVIQNTNYIIEIVRKTGKRYRRIVYITIYNLLVNIGPHQSIFPAIKSLSDELLIDDRMAEGQRNDIFDLIVVWMFHEKKGKLEPNDYRLIDSLRDLKEPICINKEVGFWKQMRRIGYKKGYPQYLNQMDIEQ